MIVVGELVLVSTNDNLASNNTEDVFLCVRQHVSGDCQQTVRVESWRMPRRGSRIESIKALDDPIYGSAEEARNGFGFGWHGRDGTRISTEVMGANGAGVQVTVDEALRIASFLESFLPRLAPDERVRVDLAITDQVYPTAIVADDPAFWMHYGRHESLAGTTAAVPHAIARLRSRLAD